MHNTEFEWDENKEKRNQKIHGIGFLEASTVFSDPFCIIIEETSTIAYEPRYIAVGQTSFGTQVIMVIHTYRDDNDDEVIRIISARKLSKGEVRKYGYC